LTQKDDALAPPGDDIAHPDGDIAYARHGKPVTVVDQLLTSLL